MEKIKKQKDSRSNDYYEARVNWYSYPKGIVLAGKEIVTSDKCGTLRKFFAPMDKSEYKFGGYNCNKLSCPECVMEVSDKRAIPASMRILAYARLLKKDIRMYSMNLLTAKSLRVLQEGEKKDAFEARMKKTEWMVQKENESGAQWRKRIETRLTEIIMESGLSGFMLILHADRINASTGYRDYEPHYHVVGSGFLVNSDYFYKKYGFTYSNTLKRNDGYKIDINKKDNDNLYSLNRRVSYLLNHSATFVNEKGNVLHTILYKGGMSYRKLKLVESYIEKQEVLSESGLPYIQQELPKNMIVKKRPEVVRKKIKTLRKVIYRYAQTFMDNKQMFYFPLEWEREYNFLINQIYSESYFRYKKWSKAPLKPVYRKTRRKGTYQYDNEYIYLYEYEIIQKFEMNGMTTLVSSNELDDKPNSIYKYKYEQANLIDYTNIILAD